MNRDALTAATADWIETVVVGHNFCPFAKRELRRKAVRYAVAEGDAETLLAALLAECRHLDADAGTETALLILAAGADDFEDYLDLTAMAEDLLAEHGYEGVYQVASFHPEYRFADADSDDAANYTNRSPYPMWHLLREDSLSAAIDAYPDVDAIPENNIAKARTLGAAHWQALLEALRR
ncbi:DUF1415 domain-containing protein [Arenimonas maotaiensis]|uniref:DUF1415 domain-containing protein n=1 Tax=Arenimonas maotaiensis TaxID=1446479 RepID=A0A917CJ24_9GAMM|nr:DUF1415 domain-containing protein [Arenimonas maotaiensis]GGF89220.1 DUF1415 domain-containing protein [Arenimonas maotaiensis]